MEQGTDKIPESFVKSKILSYPLDSLIRFAGAKGIGYPEGSTKEDFVDLIFRQSREVAYELYDATETRKNVTRDLLLERSGGGAEEPGEDATRDDLVLSLIEAERKQILWDVQLLMSQERAKTFRRYVLTGGEVETDLEALLDPSTPAFDGLREEIETRLSFPGKLATLERVLARDQSYLFFIKYVDKIKYAEEMEGRHWDTLIRRVVAVLHPPTKTLEVGTPDPNREAKALSTLSAFLTGSEDAFTGWSISAGDLLTSISDQDWRSDSGGSGPVGISYVDFTNIDLEGRPQKISLLGDDVLLTLRSLSRGGLDLSRIGRLHKVRFVYKGRKIDLFPDEGKFIFLAYMDERQRMSFYDWVSAMGWA
jgi:hypothetical protein